MKKKNVVIGLVGLLSLGSLYPLNVQAVEEKANVESDVIVEVVAGDVEGGTEEDITTKPQDGSDFLIKGVSDFDFKQIPLGETRAAAMITDGVKKYSQGIEVADVTGDGTGWKVQVGMKSFVIASGAHKDEELKGWKLEIPKGQIKSKSSSLATEYLPTTHGIELTGTNSAVLFQADAGKGMGRYTNIFEEYQADADLKRKTGVQLSIPLTARKANYIGKLEWKLYNVPGVTPES